MTLETARLTLAPWQTADWAAFRPIATDPEVMRYITGGVPWTDEQIQAFVGRQLKVYRERGFCRWKLIEKATGELIGFCGVGFWMDSTEPEIGWWLARRWWGRGLATEAAVAALRDAFERVELRPADLRGRARECRLDPHHAEAGADLRSRVRSRGLRTGAIRHGPRAVGRPDGVSSKEAIRFQR